MTNEPVNRGSSARQSLLFQHNGDLYTTHAWRAAVNLVPTNDNWRTTLAIPRQRSHRPDGDTHLTFACGPREMMLRPRAQTGFGGLVDIAELGAEHADERRHHADRHVFFALHHFYGLRRGLQDRCHLLHGVPVQRFDARRRLADRHQTREALLVLQSYPPW